MDSADRFVVTGDFAFVGRTLAEYRRLFSLDVDALSGARVLDCPGGTGSFVAEARERGVEAIAADPLYERPGGVLRERCERDRERIVDQLPAKRDLFEWDFYGDVATRDAYLRRASERFLSDRAAAPGRYVAAAVPDLPFRTDAFDLVLSAHLLFLYDDRLDERFHLAALRELARVGREVRVYPLQGLDAEPSRHLVPVLETLKDDGYDLVREPVPFEFQAGATEMLVVGRHGDDGGREPSAEGMSR